MEFAINCTLVFQVLNFFIAYLLLKRFLLKPAIDFLLQKEAAQTALEAQIQQQERLIDQKNQKISNAWLKARAGFTQKINTLFNRSIETVDELQPVSITDISDAEKKVIKDNVKAVLLKKVENVRH